MPRLAYEMNGDDIVLNTGCAEAESLQNPETTFPAPAEYQTPGESKVELVQRIKKLEATPGDDAIDPDLCEVLGRGAANDGDKDLAYASAVQETAKFGTDRRLRLSYKGQQIHTNTTFVDFGPTAVAKAEDTTISSIRTHQRTLSRFLGEERLERMLDPRARSGLRRIALGCMLLILCVIIIPTVLVLALGNAVGDELAQVQDRELRGDPAYLGDFFAGECYGTKELFAAVLPRMEAVQAEFGWQPVSFAARGTDRAVSGLYMQSPSGSAAPRVVIAHGKGVNLLHHSVQTAAAFLRAMRYSVLVLDLRVHGGRGTSLFWDDWDGEWQDILGAWDLAAFDAQGEIGGPVGVNAVGLLGFEFGGLSAQVAFAKEPRVRALLVDGAPHDLEALFRQASQERLSDIFLGGAGLLEDGMVDTAWSRSEDNSGRNLKNDPERRLPELLRQRSGGKVGIIHAADDQVIPVQQAQSLRQAASSSEVLLDWRPKVEKCASKRSIHLEKSGSYFAAQCSFWGQALVSSAAGLATSTSECETAAASLGPLP